MHMKFVVLSVVAVFVGSFGGIFESLHAQGRTSNYQLDRIEDKLDETLRKLDRIERELKHSGKPPVSNFEVVSRVDLDCVATLNSSFSTVEQRETYLRECRLADLEELQSECREKARSNDTVCYASVVRSFDNQNDKMSFMNLCREYTFVCPYGLVRPY